MFRAETRKREATSRTAQTTKDEMRAAVPLKYLYGDVTNGIFRYRNVIGYRLDAFLAASSSDGWYSELAS